MPIYETQLTMSTNNDSRQQAVSEVPVVEYDEQHGEWLKDMRGWLIVLATLAASVTYSAGLNPPGGFWSGDKDDGGVPGNPVLRDGQFVNRFLTFYYFNATAFATSLVIVILLLNERFYTSEPKVAALTLTTVVDLISLVGAYIAGSTRNMPDSIYIIVLTCFLFACVVYFARVLPNLCFILLFMAPPLFWLAEKGCLPVTDRIKNRVLRAKKREEDARKQRAEGGANERATWCYCCSCRRAFQYGSEEETGSGTA